MEWYTIHNAGQLDTPALVVYPDRVKANIRLAVGMAGSPERLRPHVKTHKSPEVTRLLLEAGITRFKCATIAEAEMLALEGAEWARKGAAQGALSMQQRAAWTGRAHAEQQRKSAEQSGKRSPQPGVPVKRIDVLLAYQPVGPKVQRLVRLIRTYPSTRFSCLIDNETSAGAMSAVFAAAGLRVPVYIDLDLGMGRTGVLPGPEAHRLYKSAAKLAGIEVVGLHAYDGHIRDADVTQRRKKCDAAFAEVEALRQSIDPGLTIVAGGSPTFPIHSQRENVECSPGTFVYWDKGYGDGCPEQGFLPAALVVTRVVSLPGKDRVCLDLGHKSIAAENQLASRVSFLNAPGLRPVGQSEEHLVMEALAGSNTAVDGMTALADSNTGADTKTDQASSGNAAVQKPDQMPRHTYQIGDIIYGIPYHICPTVALYERALTVQEGKWEGEWKNSARDRIISI